MLLFAAVPAQAEDRAYAFDIPRKSLESELIDFALQAHVSVGTAKVERCARFGQALTGRFTLTAALDRILAGSGCGYRMLDAQAFDIVPLRPPRQQSPRAEPAAPPPPPAALTEVVVVGARRSTPADRAPYSVSEVGSRALSDQGVHDAAGLAQVIPAMTVTNLGLGRDKIFLRGLSDGPITGRIQSMVGLYLDDVRLTYNAPDPDLRLVDVARVEVVRGPQAALYGAGSMTGVVQIVAVQPVSDRRESSVRVELIDATRTGGSYAIDSVFNAPFLGGRGAVRLVAYDEVQGGYIRDPGLGLTHANRSSRSGARLGLKFDIDDRWTVTAGAVDQEIKANDSQYVFAGLPPYTRRNQVREPYDNDFGDVHIGLRGALAGADLRLSTAYIHHSLASRYDASVAPPVATPPGPDVFDEHDDINSLVAELTLTAKPDARIQWLVGAFLAHTDQRTLSSLNNLGATPVLAFDEARLDRIGEAAVFGDLTLPLGSSIKVTLGGRLFSSRTGVSASSRAPILAAASAFSGRTAQAGFAPKLVLSYNPRPALLIYVQAAEGYRAGGFNSGPPGQSFDPTGAAEPSRTYRGDELWSLEAGGKIRLFDDRLWLRIAAFASSWRNIQSDQLLASGLPFTANLGDGSNRGLEFEASYRSGALELHGQFQLNQPELTHPSPAAPGRADFGLAETPSNSAGIQGRYSWPLSRDWTFQIDGRLSHVGASRLTLDAATSRKMDDYVTGRLAASLADRSFRWTLAVDNPMNSRADTFAFGNPFSLRATRQETPLRPRALSLTLSTAF